ncbi:MAG: hypothetical protein ACFFCS_24090 [Candidatus Hodarchaeota archaeon]
MQSKFYVDEIIVTKTILTYLAEWDEDEGPKIIDAHPKPKKLDLEDITMQIFTSFQTVFGYSDDVSFDRTNLVLPLKSYKTTAKILLDSYRTKKVRGGKLPFIIAFLVPVQFIQRELYIYNPIQEKIVDEYSKDKKITLKDYYDEITGKTDNFAVEVKKEAEALLKSKEYEDSVEKFRSAVFLAKMTKNDDLLDEIMKKFEPALSKFAKELLNSASEKAKQGDYTKAEREHFHTMRLAKESKNDGMIESYTKKKNDFYGKWIKDLEKQGKSFLKEKNTKEARAIYDKILKIANKTKDEKLIAKYEKEMGKIPE